MYRSTIILRPTRLPRTPTAPPSTRPTARRASIDWARWSAECQRGSCSPITRTTANLANAPNNINPFRLSHSQITTCDQNHDYGPEQMAFDLGLMDLFPKTVGTGAPGCLDYGKGKGLVMGYFDGNTTTALWNYAQH